MYDSINPARFGTRLFSLNPELDSPVLYRTQGAPPLYGISETVSPRLAAGSDTPGIAPPPTLVDSSWTGAKLKALRNFNIKINVYKRHKPEP